MFLLPIGGLTIALILVGFLIGGLFVTGLILNVGVGVLLGFIWHNAPDILAYIAATVAVILAINAVGCPIGTFFAEAAHIKGSDSKALLTKIYDQTRALTGLLFLSMLITLGVECVVEVGRLVRNEIHLQSVFLDITYYLACSFAIGLVVTAVLAVIVKTSTSRRSS